MKFPQSIRRAIMLAALFPLLLGLGAVASASAASASVGTSVSKSVSASDTGWIRLAHLSPNTPAVDVYLYSFGDSSALLVVHSVAYGTVSSYQPLAAGDYSVAMRAAGAAATSKPVLSASVDVVAARAAGTLHAPNRMAMGAANIFKNIKCSLVRLPQFGLALRPGGGLTMR